MSELENNEVSVELTLESSHTVSENCTHIETNLESSKCCDKHHRPEINIDVNDMYTHSICFNNCENNKAIVLQSQNLSSVGRFLSVTTTIKNVCPNKQIAIGLRLYETTGGCKVIKGHKMFAVSHDRDCCSDITLSNIHFVLPEEIAETEDTNNICSMRTFDLETTSHYINLSEV